MKILSKLEGEKWLTEIGLEYSDKRICNKPFKYNSAYLIPVDSGKKTIISRLLVNDIITNSNGCLWITSWGAWPSQANMELFHGYRKYLGEERPLIEAPFHIFNSADSKKLESLIGMCLYFFWDFYLVDGLNLLIKGDNDEVLQIYVQDEKKFIDLDRDLKNLELKKFRAPKMN